MQWTQNIQNNLKKKKVEELTLADFISYYNIIKSV